MNRRRDDQGNALVEFVYLGVLLMVPLIYALLTAFQVQSAAFGATEAARQAARAYVRADTVQDAQQHADAAAALAMADQGVRDSDPPQIACPAGCLTPGSPVTVTMHYRVPLLLLGALFSRSSAPGIPITAVHTQTVDRFQDSRAEPTG